MPTHLQAGQANGRMFTKVTEGQQTNTRQCTSIAHKNKTKNKNKVIQLAVGKPCYPIEGLV